MSDHAEHYLKRELYELVRKDGTIFEFLQAGSLDGLWFWDVEQPAQEWLSPRFKAVFGYADEEIPNTSAWWQENIFPEDLPVVLDNFNRHCAEPQHPYDQVVRYRHKNGSTVWIRCRGIGIRDAAGKVIRMLGAHTDVTAVLKAQELLHRRAARTATEHLLEEISDAFVALDRQWCFTYVNAQAALIFGRPAGDLIGKEVWTEFPESQNQFRPAFERALQSRQAVELEEYYLPFDRWLEVRAHPTQEGLSVFFRDTTVRKRSQAMVSGQNRILEMVALGADLSGTLDSLLRILEAQSPDLLCSILLLDGDGKRVRHGAAPSLPPEFSRAIDGAPIGPVAGSCGTAMYRREPVFVADIASDPLWAGYKDLALPHGLRACWSTPIFDAERKVLGSFAIYFRQPGLPNDWHQELIDFATHTAAICISRQHAAAALQQSEARYALAVRGTQDGLWDWDIVRNETYLTPRWKALLGFADDELASREESFYARLHPDDREATRAAVQAHLEHRLPYDREIRLQTNTGEYRWFRASGQAEWDDAGRPVRMAGALADIHARKLAEAALILERSQATAVLNSLSPHIAVVDDQGVVLAVNEAWRRFARANDAGDSSSVLPGSNYLAVLEHAAQAGEVQARTALDGIRQVLQGEREHFELEYPCDSPKEARRFLMIVTALQGRRGAVLAHEDITVRTLAEKAMRDSAMFNRQIITDASEGIVVLDRQLRYIVWNPYMEELLGLPAKDVLARHPTELFPWVQEGGQLAAMQRALAGERIVLPDNQRIRTGTKRISWIQARLAPLRDARGEIVGVIATIADITERKQAELQLQRSYEQLRALAARLQSVREEQSAHIAREIHDVLGQQLTALKLDLAWLKRRVTAVGEETLRTTLTEKVLTATSLVDDTIKTVQKVATELRPGLLDKLGLSAALEHEARIFAARSGLQCGLDLAAPPPGLELKRSIEVFRICQELLTNIARHAQGTRFDLRLTCPPGRLVLEVADDGRGITEPQLKHNGSLGLLGMRERTELLGGTLDIRPAVGKGTVAVLSIPVSIAP